jgi:ABC-type nickel/cobalt efflux system permease component RcnA
MRSFFRLAGILAIGAVAVIAHPLGNFSVNQFTRLEVSPRSLTVLQVLDLAEIPTFQARNLIDTDRDGVLSGPELDAYAASILPAYVSNLALTVDGRPVELRLTTTSAAAKDGEGGLPVLDIRWTFAADLIESDGPHRVEFTNRNYPDRIGWNEIVTRPLEGVSIFNATGFGSQLSDELRTFPESGIAAPLAERSTAFSYSTSPPPAGASPLTDRSGATTAPASRDRLADLVRIPEFTPTVVLLGLLLALGLGAMHALSPGHGKAVVGAYLVGSKGTFKHAVFLGLTVTITHTVGVFAIGLVTLFASHYILPEKLLPVLTFVSGLLVFYIGATLFKQRLFALAGIADNGHSHEHDHGIAHEHEHTGEEGHYHSHIGQPAHTHGPGSHTHGPGGHTHEPPDKITWGSLLALGISGGLLPCPSALVLMLAAISRNRVGYGLVLTIAFSLGLAGTLTAVGLAFLYLGKLFDRPSLESSWPIRLLPVVSSFVIACLGAVICYNAL